VGYILFIKVDLNKLDTPRTTITASYHWLEVVVGVVGSKSIPSVGCGSVGSTVGSTGEVGLVAVDCISIGSIGCGLASIVGLKVLTNSQSLESAKCGFWQLEHLGAKCSQGVLEPQVLHLWLVV
jgi:hypothetical protein